jgi:[ribosomal protein S5]-alanine N-acetyltransferase
MSESVTFQTPRLYLRPFEPEDGTALAPFLNHPDLAGRRYLPWDFPGDLPLSRKQVDSLLSKWSEGNKEFHLAILLRETQELVGHAVCDWGWDPHSPFLALVIAPDWQRRGYGSEVIRCLLRYLYGATPAHSISTWVAGWNEPALCFAREMGFHESGRSRCEGIRAGVVYDEILFDLLRPEWQEIEGGVVHGA